MNEIVERARLLAESLHAGQHYPPNTTTDWDPPAHVPFIAHLGQVVGVLVRFGHSDPLLIAGAWLHDAVEDAHLDLNVIEYMDRSLAHLVWAVTDEPGANRAERKKKTYPKIAQTGDDAITLKLADRIANVESSIIGHESFGFYAMYQHEHSAFEAALRQHGGDERMWDHLKYLLKK